MDHYLEHFSGDEVFCSQIMDLKSRVQERYYPSLVRFLNPHEQDVAQSLIGKHQGVKIDFYGGIVNAEMQRAIISIEEDEITADDFEVAVMELSFPGKFVKIQHKDVLGALMNIGLKRELYGDIVIMDDAAYFACDKSMVDYLIANVSKVGRGSVKIKQTNKVIERIQEYTIKQISVNSFRLDLILSEAFNISRAKANELIFGKFVKVNYKEVVQTNFLCHNNDVISLRKHGRIKIVDLQRENRKQKHVIEVWYYK